MTSELDEHDQRRAAELITFLRHRAGAVCASCASGLCAHELLFATALGYRRTPVCSACAARELGSSNLEQLRAHLRGHFDHRACYRAAWEHANQLEPSCVLATIAPRASEATATGASTQLAHESWDAGELGCGELVLDLRMKMRSMRTGEVLELFARDPGAAADLPAWCRMTGHELLDARPPRFLLRRRAD